jgi:NAD(P)-dependent dehydrogenase (short-subunit alcohol dehydrogenase family)
VRDEADNIAGLLDSMLRQTRPADEIVVNDNHSRDATPAIVERYVAEGAVAVAADMSVAAGGGLAAVPGTDGRRWEKHLDVTDPASVDTLVQGAIAAHGRIDVLVNSAGIGHGIPFLETPVEIFDRVIAVNLKGTFLVARAAAREMVGRGAGRIINIASVSGQRGNTGRAAYGASKGGVIALSQVMAVELAPRGVLVNVISPGPVETPLVARMHTAAAREAWLDRTPLGRYARPDQIAAAAVFLASDDAGHIVGHVLSVDGGFMAAGIMSG